MVWMGPRVFPHGALGKDGIIQDIGLTQQNSRIDFNTVLIITQRLWCVDLSRLSKNYSDSQHSWEVQQFVQRVHVNSGGPAEFASDYCSLSKRLEELPQGIAEIMHYEHGNVS